MDILDYGWPWRITITAPPPPRVTQVMSFIFSSQHGRITPPTWGELRPGESGFVLPSVIPSMKGLNESIIKSDKFRSHILVMINPNRLAAGA